MTQTKPVNPSSKHHYIPRLYLKRWCVNGKVAVYQRDWQGKIHCKPLAPAATGYQENLYRMPGTKPEDAQKIEEIYMRGIDTSVERSIQMMLEMKQKNWPQKDIRNFTRFFMSMLFRSPMEVAALKVRVEEKLDELSGTLEEEYAKIRGDADPESWRDYEGKHLPDHSEQLALQLLLRLIDSPNVIPKIERMNWLVLTTNQAKVKLWTCDRPIVFNGGLANPEGSIAFPISPDAFFVAAAHPALASHISNLNRKLLAKSLNQMLVGQASKFAYSAETGHERFVSNWMGKHKAPAFVANL